MTISRGSECPIRKLAFICFLAVFSFSTLAEEKLVDHLGKPFSVDQLRGNIVLLVIGFTNCEDILRNALPEQFDLDPEVEAALVDASLEFSQCMRDQGIDFPDPKPGEFGFFAFRDADIDFTSEAVQNAFEICQPENPLEDLDD